MLRCLLLWLCLVLPALAQEESLRSGRVLSLRPLASVLEHWDGSNDYYLAELEGGMQAVFRSEEEPWGSLAEVAGYRFDDWLGTHLVPLTVERTLRRGEVTPWPPWGEQRRGSMQLWVKTSKIPLKTEDLGDVETISFILGRYDNHSGNLLSDERGRPVLIDFESTLDVQKVRYGEVPFVRRGGRAPGGGRGEFPFDKPLKLVDPSLEEIRGTFGPWWNQSWPEGMTGLHHMLRHIPARTIPYAIWEERLWVQVKVASRHPAWTRYYRAQTLARLRTLDAETVTRLLGEPYRAEHVRGVLERTAQLLKEASPL